MNKELEKIKRMKERIQSYNDLISTRGDIGDQPLFSTTYLKKILRLDKSDIRKDKIEKLFND